MQGLGLNKTSRRWPSASTYVETLTAKNELSFFGSDWYLLRPIKFLVPAPRSLSWNTLYRAYDTRHKLTLPDQRTEELMIWGCAIDKQHRVVAWLGPDRNHSALAIRHNHAYCPSSRHPLFRCVAHQVTIDPRFQIGRKASFARHKLTHSRRAGQ